MHSMHCQDGVIDSSMSIPFHLSNCTEPTYMWPKIQCHSSQVQPTFELYASSLLDSSIFYSLLTFFPIPKISPLGECIFRSSFSITTLRPESVAHDKETKF